MEIRRSEVNPEEEEKDVEDEEAPYGRKADGTPKKRPGRQPGSRNTSGGTRRNLDHMKGPLADRLVEYFGPPIGAVSPLGMAVLDERAEKTANALVNLAVKRPRIKKAIESLIDGSSSLDVVLTGVGIIVAMGVDARRIDINSMPSRYFKIPDLAEETYDNTAYFYENNGKGPEARGLYSEVVS